jgi:DNA polymerase I-like protein with 3'-5' exonuclease and polymerase domains
LQIQNIPRDGNSDEDITVKEAFVADDDFYIGEADYSQAEARDTAYLSGDTSLIQAVDNPARDFHGHNASAFFGIPYSEIVNSYQSEEDGEWIHKVINKPIRDLSKRTNHGANYNMGPAVMLQTMGIEKVLKAKKLLGLPLNYTPLEVTEHLLKVFARTYPIVKGDYYQKIIQDISTTGVLQGPTGWTRRCFGSPKTNKQHLNSYVAHPSQSLNAMTLNKAYIKIFLNVYLPNPHDFKLCAQIHDSILFQYRKTRDDLPHLVKECMTMTIQVRDTFGITRQLTVPVDLKGGATRWSEVKALK